MTETLQYSPEIQHSAAILPQGQELQQAYVEQFSAMNLPATARLAAAGETPDISLMLPYAEKVTNNDLQQRIGDLQYRYSTAEAGKAESESWWGQLSEQFESEGASREQAAHISLVAKHSLAVQYEGEPTGQGFEVYEVGEAADPADSKAVLNTLELIDQYTGGLMSSDPKRPRIVLASGYNFHRKGADGSEHPTHGYADPGMIVINVPAAHRAAEKYGADAREVIAGIQDLIICCALWLQFCFQANIYFRSYFHARQNRTIAD